MAVTQLRQQRTSKIAVLQAMTLDVWQIHASPLCLIVTMAVLDVRLLMDKIQLLSFIGLIVTLAVLDVRLFVEKIFQLFAYTDVLERPEVFDLNYVLADVPPLLVYVAVVADLALGITSQCIHTLVATEPWVLAPGHLIPNLAMLDVYLLVGQSALNQVPKTDFSILGCLWQGQCLQVMRLGARSPLCGVRVGEASHPGPPHSIPGHVSTPRRIRVKRPQSSPPSAGAAQAAMGVRASWLPKSKNWRWQAGRPRDKLTKDSKHGKKAALAAWIISYTPELTAASGRSNLCTCAHGGGHCLANHKPHAIDET